MELKHVGSGDVISTHAIESEEDDTMIVYRLREGASPSLEDVIRLWREGDVVPNSKGGEVRYIKDLNSTKGTSIADLRTGTHIKVTVADVLPTQILPGDVIEFHSVDGEATDEPEDEIVISLNFSGE